MNPPVCDGHFMSVTSSNNSEKLLDTFRSRVSHEPTRVMGTEQTKTKSSFKLVDNIREGNESR